MIGYPIVFRCCECTVEEQTMEHLEKHIWSRHLQAFPFRCSICDYPAINSLSLLEHFEQNHSLCPIEFKRSLEDEKRFRKMIAESIAFEIDENAATHASPQLTVLDSMSIQQGTTQIVLLPSTNSQYEAIVEHRAADDDDFEEVLVEDENGEEIGDDDEGYGLDDLGNPAFIGAQVDYEPDPDYIVEEDLSEQGNIRPTSYHLKYMRTRRMDKLIDNVVVNAAQSSSPSTSNNQPVDEMIPHNDTSKGGRYSCDQCKKTFKYHSKLAEHRRTHLGLRPFPCPYCPRGFGQKGALKTHVRLHTGEKPFICQWECGRSFASASARTHHERTHSGERPYVCSICSKSFTKNSHVVRHFKNVHGREVYTQRSDCPDSTKTTKQSDPLDHKTDITPVGKEREVVYDIVEQIHEERKDFKVFTPL